MGMPNNVGMVDTMIGFPHDDMKAVYAFITRQTKDTQSKEEFEFPAEYMFKDVPDDLAAVRDIMGLEHLLFGSDWPHAEGLAEPRTFADDLASQGFSADEIRTVLRDNGRVLAQRMV